MLYYSPDKSVYVLLWMRICRGYGYRMLGGREWYCLCGKLFLYVNV